MRTTRPSGLWAVIFYSPPEGLGDLLVIYPSSIALIINNLNYFQTR